MTENNVKLVVADANSVPGIIPSMMAFNQIEEIEWNAEVMVPALQNLVANENLGAILVAQVASTGAIFGYCLATYGYDIEFGGRDSFVTELFVMPQHRKRGWGRALLEQTISHVQGRGANAVHLMVRPDNEKALRLYSALGFEHTPRVMMTKHLRPS